MQKNNNKNIMANHGHVHKQGKYKLWRTSLLNSKRSGIQFRGMKVKSSIKTKHQILYTSLKFRSNVCAINLYFLLVCKIL